MFIGRNYSFIQTLHWTKKHILIFIVISSVPVCIYSFTNWKIIVPWLPISLIGTAVAFYLGFKNNASYDRLWEARKIWGAIINSSRTWTMFVKGYVRDDFQITGEVALIQKRLVKRHLAWLHALRFQLRTKRMWEHPTKDEINKHIPRAEENNSSLSAVLKNYLQQDELNYIVSKTNFAAHILNLQMQDLTSLRSKNYIEDFRHMEMGNVLKDLLDNQGKCERIKNFPFPRQYASMSIYFVWLFIILLPFGLLQEFAKLGSMYVWLTIPFSVLISWVFSTMELIGDYSENPFEGLNNDIPITTISRTIEIDILEMIDEGEIPSPIQPIENILM